MSKLRGKINGNFEKIMFRSKYQSVNKMNEKVDRTETEISFFDILESAINNSSKILIITFFSLVISAAVYLLEDEQFEFSLKLSPPNELIFQDVEIFKSLDKGYDLSAQYIYDVFIFHLNDKERIIKNLKKYISTEHDYIKKKNIENYNNEIEKIAFDIKILQPVLNKDIARIRNTSLMENYTLSYKGDRLIQIALVNAIKDTLSQVSIVTEQEIENFKNNYLFKKKIKLENEKGKLLLELELIEKDFENKIEAALNVSKRKVDEDLKLINKSLKLAEKMNLKNNAFMPLNITDKNISEIQPNILSNGTDEQFEKIYYLKGSDFLREEKQLLESELPEVPSSIYDKLSQRYLINKFLINNKISKIDYGIENLEKLDELISNSPISENIDLFSYYITEANNIKNLGINYKRLIIANFIAGLIFSIILVLFYDSYNRNKSKT